MKKIKKDKIEKDEEKKVTEKEEIESKTEGKVIKEEKKEPDKVKKDIAIARGVSLRISPKHSFAVCKSIKGRSPKAAIERLESVLKNKRAIPMTGREVGHKKGKGFAGARFPKIACMEIIKIIKQAEANATISGIENPVITIAKADIASAPYRKGGTKAKRTHVYLEVRDKIKLAEKKK